VYRKPHYRKERPLLQKEDKVGKAYTGERKAGIKKAGFIHDGMGEGRQRRKGMGQDGREGKQRDWQDGGNRKWERVCLPGGACGSMWEQACRGYIVHEAGWEWDVGMRFLGSPGIKVYRVQLVADFTREKWGITTPDGYPGLAIPLKVLGFLRFH
jgi:hypothetical protein